MNVEFGLKKVNGIFLFESFRNFFVATVLGWLYYLYDIFSYVVSNKFNFFSSVFILSAILLLCSLIFVFIHQWTRKKRGYDILGLEKFNQLSQEDVQRYRFFRRFLKWIMCRRVTIYFLGSIFIGPHVVALLLRKNEKMSSTICFYLIPTTLISVLTWVLIMKGVGLLTWNQYVKPFLDSVI